jgi:hypothetical protein
MSDFKKNLEKAGYEVETIDEDEIEEMFEMINLDYADYKLEKMVVAVNSQRLLSITIIECSSSSKAEKLAEDLEGKATNTFCETEGAFVLLGSKEAIEDAKNTASKNDNTPASPSINDYENSLNGAGYEVYSYSKNQSESFLSAYKLNLSDYGVRNVISDGANIIVIECGTAEDASRLFRDISNASRYNPLDRPDTFITQLTSSRTLATGAFYIAGTPEAVAAAETASAN